MKVPERLVRIPGRDKQLRPAVRLAVRDEHREDGGTNHHFVVVPTSSKRLPPGARWATEDERDIFLSGEAGDAFEK